MAENVLLEKQDISGFLFAENYGAYVFYTTPAPYSLEANGEYIILWDDVEHTRTAFSFTAADGAACVGVGNPVAAGLEANEDTFVIVYDSTNSILYYFSLVEGESHNVQVSQIVEDVEPEPEPDPEPEEPETPEGIVLKDRNGNDVAYYGIETVTFDTTTEGKQQTYSKGVVAESQKIPVTFAEGDMPIKASEGYLLKEFILQKPDTLLPENIRDGVTVAAVTGTLKSMPDSGVEYELNDSGYPRKVKFFGQVKTIMGCVSSFIEEVDFADGYGYTQVGLYAFHQTRIASLEIPEGVVSILNNGISANSYLETLILPSTLTSIGMYSCYANRLLKSITIPAAVGKIDKYAFFGDSALTSVVFENPNGWYYSDTSGATTGTAIAASVLSDPASAATALTSTYAYKYLFRK